MTATMGDLVVESVVHDALIRRATERLIRLRDIRAARQLAQAGRTQREIADALHVTQPRVHRMLRAGEKIGDTESPEEIILRATVEHTSRESLVQTLGKQQYTFRRHAPEPFDGATHGTWDQVRSALVAGLISEDEFSRVQAAVGVPAS